MVKTKILPGALALALDQITKIWARASLAGGDGVIVVPGVLAFRYYENTGAAFSFLASRPALIFVLTALLTLGVILWLARDKKLDALSAVGLSLIAGGALGNLIDRALFGCVTDFIEVLFVRFAVFNGADTAIVVGAACVALGTLIGARKR